MNDFNNPDIEYKEADHSLRERVSTEWGEKAALHMHIDDGFSIVGLHHEKIVGLISVFWKLLPAPLNETHEGYIDIIEVAADYRRKGIARKMVELAAKRSRARNVYQMRAWSSEDKIQAIPMWKELGFGLCPAITYPRGQKVKGYFVVKILEY